MVQRNVLRFSSLAVGKSLMLLVRGEVDPDPDPDPVLAP